MILYHIARPKYAADLSGEDSHTYIINVSHPQAASVRIVSIDPFQVDSRILAQKA